MNLLTLFLYQVAFPKPTRMRKSGYSLKQLHQICLYLPLNSTQPQDIGQNVETSLVDFQRKFAKTLRSDFIMT